MPLYDCVMLLKPHVKKEALMDLVARVGRHVLSRNGVITDIQSFGTVQLGYGIKKLDGRHYQGQLMQMTMMATPNINKELHYLNKEDRLLRWLLVKNRDLTHGLKYLDENDDDGDSDDDGASELSKFRSTFYNDGDITEDDDEDNDEEYEDEAEDEEEHGMDGEDNK